MAAAGVTGPFPAQTPGGVTVNAAGVPSNLNFPPPPIPDAPGSLFDKALGFAEKNPLALAGMGIMGVDMLMGNKPLPAQGQLQSLAGSNAASAASLESFVQTGKLPPGMQTAVDLTMKSEEASIRSRMAHMGLSGSTQEAQMIAGAKERATASVANIAKDLFAQGVQLSGISGQELAALLQAQMTQEAGFQNALGRFAGGLAGARMTGSSG
jgi:hypothetical protein